MKKEKAIEIDKEIKKYVIRVDAVKNEWTLKGDFWKVLDYNFRREDDYKNLCIDCCEKLNICHFCDSRAGHRGTCDRCKRYFNYE